MSAPGHVAVLMGGPSPERDVSLVSGRMCADALEGEGFRVSVLDPGPDCAIQLGEIAPDAVFNALHGRWGEDGCVQGLLEWMRLPYTHSGVLASALAMDKDAARRVFAAAGLPVAKGVAASREEAVRAHLLCPPYVIKPVQGGSSLGVHMVERGANAPPAALASCAWAYGERVLVEEYIAGRELTCAVIDGEPFGVTEIVCGDGFYDYQAKYAPGGSRHLLPAPIDEGVRAEAQRMAVGAYRALGCRGLTRADFRYDPDAGRGGRLVVLEMNTQPGMTPTSLAPEQAALRGMDFAALVRWMIGDASCQR